MAYFIMKYKRIFLKTQAKQMAPWDKGRDERHIFETTNLATIAKESIRLHNFIYFSVSINVRQNCEFSLGFFFYIAFPQLLFPSWRHPFSLQEKHIFTIFLPFRWQNICLERAHKIQNLFLSTCLFACLLRQSHCLPIQFGSHCSDKHHDPKKLGADKGLFHFTACSPSFREDRAAI